MKMSFVKPEQINDLLPSDKFLRKAKPKDVKHSQQKAPTNNKASLSRVGLFFHDLGDLEKQCCFRIL